MPDGMNAACQFLFWAFVKPVVNSSILHSILVLVLQTKKDAVYTWKALRQMSRTSLPVFSKLLSPTQPKARKGAATKEDKRDGDLRAKLDLEDAVHELFSVSRQGAKIAAQ